MNRSALGIVGAVALATGLGGVGLRGEAASAADGYIYAPPSHYVVPPATVYDPVILSPVPVQTVPPFVVVPPNGRFVAPAPPVGFYGGMGYGGYPQTYRYDGSGRYVREEYKVYGPFGVQKQKYKYDRRYGTMKFEQEFDD